MSMEKLIAAANGEEPADLVLKNGQLVNVFSGEILPVNVGIAGGRLRRLRRGAGEHYRARRARFFGAYCLRQPHQFRDRGSCLRCERRAGSSA